MKYQAMSETVLKAVGGKENITSVTHCATRLRIDARDTSIDRVENVGVRVTP